MDEFKDKVCVITGAGSGIGLELSKICVENGMKVVLADINEDSISTLEKELKSNGGDVISVVTNVMSAEAVDVLAKKTIDTFGKVDYVFNNAGIIWQKPIWDSDLSDWQRIIGVNIWGVVHGMKSFLPIMLKQGSGHIINTGSLSGMMVGELENSAYYGSKSSVIALTEAVEQEMKLIGANIKLSVVVPTMVATKLVAPKEESNLKSKEKVDKMFQAGASADFTALKILEGVQKEKFYILPDATLVASFMSSERSRCILRGIRKSKT